MTQLDPKWIKLDDTKLALFDNNGVNELSLKDDIILAGINVELVNSGKIQVRYLSEGAPTEDVRDMSRDFWIQVPDQV
jgi:hypothetical protein